MITIIDAQGRAKEIKSRVRAFGVQNPLTLATITAVVGFVVGLVLG